MYGTRLITAFKHGIDLNHLDKEDWHIFIDAFVLDTTNGLVELLTTMTDLNK
jgi:hypothetical protein